MKRSFLTLHRQQHKTTFKKDSKYIYKIVHVISMVQLCYYEASIILFLCTKKTKIMTLFNFFLIFCVSCRTFTRVPRCIWCDVAQAGASVLTSNPEALHLLYKQRKCAGIHCSALIIQNRIHYLIKLFFSVLCTHKVCHMDYFNNVLN